MVFALHAVVATIVIIIQCSVYERGQQRVSILARILLGIYAICTIVMSILGGVDVVHWLDFLYYCSYVKLSITIMKYIPQVSDLGWNQEFSFRSLFFLIQISLLAVGCIELSTEKYRGLEHREYPT